MHLSTKQISMLGLLLAFSVVLNVLSGVIETSTLFLLSAASFFVGIAFRETNKLLGIGFYIASVLLSFILAPNKMYCFTYAAIGLYIVIIELFRGIIVLKKDSEKKDIGKKSLIEGIALIGCKLVIFNLIFIPILIFLPELIIAKELSPTAMLFFVLSGQIIFVIYDKAYDYFMLRYWEKYKRNFFR